MADIEPVHIARPDAAGRAKRWTFALRAQEIEGNPLDAEDIALFERMEREGLNDEQRLAVLNREAKKLALG